MQPRHVFPAMALLTAVLLAAPGLATAPAKGADFTLKYGVVTQGDMQHLYGLKLKEVVEKATKAIKEKGEEKAKDEIKTFAADEMKKHANSIIPAPFQSKAGEIIDKAAEKMAERAIEEAKKVAGIK